MSNHGGGFHWPQHMVDRMVHLYTVDGWSCGTIADELGNGLTRCAIIGKLHRLKVSREYGPSVSKPKGSFRKAFSGKEGGKRTITTPEGRRIKLKHWKQRPHPKPAVYAIPKPPKLPEPSSLGLTFLQLTKNTCKWPHGEGPFTFCGHASKEGRPYCAYHCGVAFVDVPRKANPRPFRRAA